MLETTVSKLPLLVWSSQGSYCLGTVWPAGSPIPNKTPRLLCSANHGRVLLIVQLQFGAAFLEFFCGEILCWRSALPPSIWSCLLNFGVVLWGFTVFELCSANDGTAPFKFLQTNCSPSILSSAQPMMVQLSFKFPQTDCSPSILRYAQPMMLQPSFKFPQTDCSTSILSPAQPMIVQLSFKFPQTDCSPSILSSAQPMMVQLSFKFPQTGCSPSIRSSCFLGGNIVFDLCSANDGTAPFKLLKTNCSSSI